MVASVSALSSSAQATCYHNHDDYYFKDRGPSEWSGELAKRFGIDGQQVDQQLFSQLLAGKIPTHLLNQEQQNDNRNGRTGSRNDGVAGLDANRTGAAPGTYALQPHLGGLPRTAENGMRVLSECRLATVGEQQLAGVLSIDARDLGSKSEELRRENSGVTPDETKAQKLEEFLQIHRGGGKQRAGVDITFSAPKSFSILALAGDRPDLVKMFDEAVKETLAEMEKQAGCRFTIDKETQKVVTGNYLIAEFNHSTSRPVTLAQLESLGGDYADQAARMRETGAKYTIDPNLHKHALVMNMTWCEETQSFKALDNHPLFRDQMLAGAMFHASLAAKCREVGIALRDFGANGEFELASVDQKMVDKFSIRSALIVAELDRQGLTRETASQAQLETATLKTRNAKDHGIDRNELSGEWIERLTRIEKDLGVSLETALRAEYAEESGGPKTAKEGIESGLRHHMERASIVKEADVARWAIAKSRGYYSVSDVNKTLAEMKSSGALITGEMKRQDSQGEAKGNRAFEESNANDSMIKYAKVIAEKQGLTAPESKKFTEVRKFLDEHAPRKIGLEDRSGNNDSGKFAANARPGEIVLTTREAQQRERDMIKSVQSGHGTMPAILAKERATQILADRQATMQKAAFDKATAEGKSPAEAQSIAAKAGLNGGQQDVARLILTSTDRVNTVLGVAGSGKSFTLGQTKELIETQAQEMGLKIHGVAPSHQAKNELREVTGTGDTLQSFLTNPKERERFGKSHLLIIDEAGMASIKQMSELERISAKHGFRYLLVGDLRQTAAVEAGKPLEQISKVTNTQNMNDSVRHKTDHLKKSAKLAADGRMAESLAPLHVKEIKDSSERRKYIAERFTDIGKQAEQKASAAGKTEGEAKTEGAAARRETLLLTTTNESRREINEHVRVNLGLAGQGREVNTLHQKDTTAESRRFLSDYIPGDVLQFSSEYKSLGVKSGDRLSVTEVQSDKLILTDKDGQNREFRPGNFKTENWGAYTPDRIELAAGDRVRLRENTKQFQNGDWGNVASINDKTMTIQSEKDPKQTWTINHADRATCVDHGYAMTAHGAQGATRDRTLVDMDTNSRALTKETAYVMNTRSREDIEIVTNSTKNLPDAISRAADKPNALDIGERNNETTSAQPNSRAAEAPRAKQQEQSRSPEMEM